MENLFLLEFGRDPVVRGSSGLKPVRRRAPEKKSTSACARERCRRVEVHSLASIDITFSQAQKGQMLGYEAFSLPHEEKEEARGNVSEQSETTNGKTLDDVLPCGVPCGQPRKRDMPLPSVLHCAPPSPPGGKRAGEESRGQQGKTEFTCCSGALRWPADERRKSK